MEKLHTHIPHTYTQTQTEIHSCKFTHLNDEKNKSDKSMLAHTHTHTCSGEISVGAMNGARAAWACKVESCSAASLAARLLTATLLRAPSSRPLRHLYFGPALQNARKEVSTTSTHRYTQLSVKKDLCWRKSAVRWTLSNTGAEYRYAKTSKIVDIYSVSKLIHHLGE